MTTNKRSNWILSLLQKKSNELYTRYIDLEDKITKHILPFANLPNFTDHGVAHSFNVQDILASIIPKKNPLLLKPFEIFALLLASLLHDTGMLMSKNENEGSHEIRIDHFFRSREFVINNRKELGLSEHEAFVIGEICRAHGMPNLKYLEGKPFSIYKHGKIDILFLSALLRLSDALDIVADRAPEIVSENREMPNLSKHNWELHHCVSDVQIETAPSWDIVIVAIPTKKSLESELIELQNRIQDELDIISPILRAS